MIRKQKIVERTHHGYSQAQLCGKLPKITHCSKSSLFVQKFNFDFTRKIVEVFWVKTRENVAVLDFLGVDNFDFTRKIVKKKFG